MRKRKVPAVEKQTFTLRLDAKMTEEVMKLADRHVWSVSQTLAQLVQRAVQNKVLG